ncbi:TonB-dependent receptor [Carboxylicivirga sp. A043]|uniref:SusC/RagA family TonB-linked outer membrane protein n=1 Tax=Carboxylicivirga litoralis TaxID=2816963 RepID=UPI0021CAE353|nr:TonB-dependent receptor [Carboxylicivirga sp. A043]MCU4157654.1 TonB-dependent receptor [Carboxylicivirga sp. A043]
MRKIACLLFVLLLIGQTSLFAQSTITGRVVSNEDGEPIPGVSVVVKGTSIGTVTDYEGNYSLSTPADAITLVFSFVGMTTQEIPINGQTVINVNLKGDDVEVGEVMVVAYGTAKKESFTGSAEVVGVEKLEKRVASDITKAIDGQVAGVQSTSGSGQPGEGASIRIRGFGSINSSNAPLYVVDGIPYDGNLNAISNSDIESVTVLKDASAGALYGSRGANGVVLITTKKGKSGKTSIELKVSRGIANRAIKPYETLNATEYIETAFQGYKNQLIYQKNVAPHLAGELALAEMNGNNGIFGANEQYNFFDMPVASLIDPTTGKVNPNANLAFESDWQDEITNENAIRQEYQILVNGGTEKIQLFSSFAYLEEEGLLKNTNFERFSGRVGAEFETEPWIKYGGNVNFAKTKTDYLSATATQSSNVWYSAQFMPSLYPVYERERNGDLILSETGEKQFDYGINRPSGASANFNSVANLYEDESVRQFDNMSGRFHIDLIGDGISNFVSGLSLSTTIGFDLANENRYLYNNPDFGSFASAKGYLTKYNIRTFSYTWNQLLRYNKDFGEHSLGVLLGHENYEYRYNYMRGEKSGFPFAGIVELAPGTTTKDLTSYEDNYAIESYFTNITYDFKDRYYLSASFRADASSRFHKDNRWGNFWSLGASWRLSEESFMAGVDFIDNLTLKASYGLQGNDNINTVDEDNYYAWQTLYDLTWPNATLGGSRLADLGNEDIKWEENLNFNIGIEARLFNRANFTFEYYNRKTIDMLMKRPMPLSTGFENYWDNVGEMSNKGIEFSTAVEVVKSTNFNWIASVNLSTVKNEILKLDGEKDQIISGIRINKVGEEINSFWLAKSAGVDPTNGAQLYHVFEEDEDGNRTYSISDQKSEAVNSSVISGSRIPDFYGSFGSEFTFLRNFDASFLTTFSVGGYVYDYLYQDLLNPIYVGANYHKNIKRAWQQPGDVTDIPRVENGTGFARAQNDAGLIDASYFAIKNITLGYTLPENVVSSIGIDRVRLYITLDNIALFSHLDGLDPQYNFSGSTDYVYAPVSTTLFGIDVKF